MRGASHPVGAAIIIAMWSGYPVSTGLQMASGSRRPTAPGWPLLLLSTGLDRGGARKAEDRSIPANPEIHRRTSSSGNTRTRTQRRDAPGPRSTQT